MDGSAAALQRTLTYGREKFARQAIILAAAFLVLGVIGASLDRWPDVAKFGWVVGGVGVAHAFFELFVKQSLPGKPLLELSPEGLSLHTAGHVLIPWHEVHGVDSIELNTWTLTNSPFPAGCTKFTVVLVSRDFYHRRIVPALPAMPSDDVKSTFIPQGTRESALMQVVLHHEMLPVAPGDLRREVVARWRAYRGSGRPADAPVPSLGGRPVEFRIKRDEQ